MVTFAFFLTGTLLLVLTLSFDVVLFHYTLKQAFGHLLITDVATGRYIVLFAAIVGLAVAIITDYRLYKNSRHLNSK